MSYYFLRVMKKTLIIAFFIGLVLPMAAQLSQSAFHLLRLPTSAKVAALGGENISLLDNDAAAVMHNPALLSEVDDNTLGLSFMSYADGAKWMGAQWVRSFGERHTSAAFAQYMGYGTMTETDATGTPLGTFSPKDIIVGAGYSYLLSDRWAGGANLKVLYSSLANYSAAAIAVDLGLNYYNEENDMSLSLALRNVGAQLKSYDHRTESVPYSLQLGYTKGLAHLPLRFSITAIDLTRWRQRDYYVTEGEKMSFSRLALNHLVLGAQLRPTDLLSISVGYNFRRAYELKAAALAGLSAGVGIHLSRFQLQLAYARYHRSTTTLMGTASYAF